MRRATVLGGEPVGEARTFVGVGIPFMLGMVRHKFATNFTFVVLERERRDGARAVLVPDRSNLDVSWERMHVPEVLFDPGLLRTSLSPIIGIPTVPRK